MRVAFCIPSPTPRAGRPVCTAVGALSTSHQPSHLPFTPPSILPCTSPSFRLDRDRLCAHSQTSMSMCFDAFFNCFGHALYCTQPHAADAGVSSITHCSRAHVDTHAHVRATSAGAMTRVEEITGKKVSNTPFEYTLRHPSNASVSVSPFVEVTSLDSTGRVCMSVCLSVCLFVGCVRACVCVCAHGSYANFTTCCGLSSFLLLP
jgi:hypothetical protein